jgi:hypothetical protein
MKIRVASVSKSGGSEGFWGRAKGMIANLFIVSPKVDRLGNTTMLEFGYALPKKMAGSPFRRLRISRKTR